MFKVLRPGFKPQGEDEGRVDIIAQCENVKIVHQEESIVSTEFAGFRIG